MKKEDLKLEKIDKGDIIEVLNIDYNTKLNGKIEVGNRYIVENPPFGTDLGYIKIINPQNSSYSILATGQYTLYKKARKKLFWIF